MEFRNFYMIFGIYEEKPPRDVEEKIDIALSKANRSSITTEDKKIIETAERVLTDKETREVYDSMDHDDFVREHLGSNEELLSTENLYIDLYDLFGIHPTEDEEAIKKATREAIKSMHPTKNDSTTTEEFSTIKTCEEILNSDREQYDQLGHREYVGNNNVDLDGYMFTDGPVFETRSDVDVDALMSINPNTGHQTEREDVREDDYSTDDKGILSSSPARILIILIIGLIVGIVSYIIAGSIGAITTTVLLIAVLIVEII